MVAVLFVSRTSAYHEMDGVDIYDVDRDATTFGGGMPIVAHPPCRHWSAFCGHQSHAPQSEIDAGLWCCEILRECGGVLEQPAHSRLFEAGGLPLPGGTSGGLVSISVSQAWWGLGLHKGTWLCFAHVEPPQPPFVLHDRRGDRQRWNTMSKNRRARTTPEFAQWLVDAASRANPPSN